VGAFVAVLGELDAYHGMDEIDMGSRDFMEQLIRAVHAPPLGEPTYQYDLNVDHSEHRFINYERDPFASAASETVARFGLAQLLPKRGDRVTYDRVPDDPADQGHLN
jgi:hypothetical protein